jgi:hypothetical protein
MIFGFYLTFSPAQREARRGVYIRAVIAMPWSAEMKMRLVM